ncbi:hypothetical protein IAU59_004812 [Kwoniella sp. CBS 9459]
MAPRPQTSRSHSANSAMTSASSSTKGLPALPTGGLGLDFSGLSKEDEEFRLSINTTSKPSPTHFIPLRSSTSTSTSPFSAPLPLTLPPPFRSPSIISSSPSTPTTGSAYPFPYSNPNHSHSASTELNGSVNLNQSTSTLTAIPPASPNVSLTTPTPKKKITFGKSSMSAESMRARDVSVQSPSAGTGLNASVSSLGGEGGLGRKRSSGQLLMGIGKGLNRVGSVMRRNTAEGSERASPGSNSKRANGSGADAGEAGGGAGPGKWRKGGRRKASQTPDERWEKIDRLEAGEGDAGIGRPFNVGHDLHVSPDLGDLPPTWLESLKEQGLTESDLLLISAASKKQRATHQIPLHQHHPSLNLHSSDQGHGGTPHDAIASSGRAPRAPLSAPAPVSGFLGMPFQPDSPMLKIAIPLVSGEAGSSAHISTGVSAAASGKASPRAAGSKGLLLRKFSFERAVRPPALRARSKDVFDSKPIGSSSSSARASDSPHQRKKTDSFPVSASGHSASLCHLTRCVEDDAGPARSDLTFGQDSSEVIEIVAKDDQPPTRRKNKRFSDQLKGFRESTFGLDEVDENWGSNIISAAWSGTASALAPQAASSSTTLRSKSSRLESVKERDFGLSSDRIPLPASRQDRHVQDKYTSSPSSSFPKSSSPEPAQATSPPISPRSPVPPTRPRKLTQTAIATAQEQPSEPNTPMAPAAPRSSSESFGVHYSHSVSKSSTSIGSEVITPCNSAEQGIEICDAIGDRDEIHSFTSAGEEHAPNHSDRLRCVARSYSNQEDHHNKNKAAGPDTSADLELHNTTFGPIQNPVLGDPIQLSSSFTSLPHLPRRYHSNPRVSLPASAGQSSALPSRCVTPTDTASASASVSASARPHHERSESGNHPATEHLSPPQGSERPSHYHQHHQHDSPARYQLKAQASYSTFDSAPFRPASTDEDPLDGLDKAITPDERASIALSILSSRTSTSMHSLHELSQATVRVAYKMPGRSTSDTAVPTRKSLGVVGANPAEMEESASSECSGLSIAGGYGSEETGEAARDAMDALGEAARRLRGM